MGRLLTWLGGALGLAALWRFLRNEQQAQRRAPEPQRDPAAELRARLDEARDATDDRDDYDAAEGQPVDQVEAPATAAAEPPGEPRSLEERRRAIHEKAQQALGEMQRPNPDE